MIPKFINIIKANVEIKRLTETLAQSEVDTLKFTEQSKADAEKIKDYEATIAAFPVADYQKVIEDMKELHTSDMAKLAVDHKEALVLLQNKLNVSESSASTKAANIVASIGISADSIPNISESAIFTAEQAATKFEAMAAGVERTKFYQENKSLILQGLRMK